MNYSSLSATDRRVLITGGVVAIVALLSFLDPSGSWGPIMALALLAGLGAVFVGLQSQLAPSMKLPAPKGLLLLILGGAATGATAIALLTYLSFIASLFGLIMIVGLVAAIVLLWTGWTAYKAETPAVAASDSPAAPAASPAAPAASTTPPPPPPPDAEA